MSDLTQLVKLILHRERPEQMKDGIIEGISGQVANVRFSGSTQATPARFNESLRPQVGDIAVLVQVNHTAPWVITATYPNPRLGKPVSQRDQPAHALGSVFSGNAVYKTKTTTITSTTSYQEHIRVEIQTRGGDLLIGAFGNGDPSANPRLITLSLAVDGSEKHSFQRRMTLADGEQVAIMTPVRNVLPGDHTVVLQALVNASNVILATNLFAIEV